MSFRAKQNGSGATICEVEESLAIERSFDSVRLRFAMSNSAQDDVLDGKTPFMNKFRTPTQSYFDFSFLQMSFDS
jgi:hypothetical protein